MGDDEDRAKLFSLPAIEREQILLERHKKRVEIMRQKELLQTLNLSEQKTEVFGNESFSKRMMSSIREKQDEPKIRKRIRDFENSPKRKNKEKSTLINPTKDLDRINSG